MDISFFVPADGGIRGLVRSRGLGDVYKKEVCMYVVVVVVVVDPSTHTHILDLLLIHI